MIYVFQYCDKFIATVTSCEIFLWHSLTHLNCKRTDIFIPFIMSQIVVDGSKIVQIKYTQRDCSILSHRFRIIQNLFTFILVRKPCRLVKIHFLLQQSVLCRITQCLDQLNSDQNDQADNITDHNFLKFVQSSCFFLRIRLCISGCLITNLEKMVTFLDNLRIFVSFFPYKIYLFF